MIIPASRANAGPQLGAVKIAWRDLVLLQTTALSWDGSGAHFFIAAIIVVW